jgi:hypothetical protein
MQQLEFCNIVQMLKTSALHGNCNVGEKLADPGHTCYVRLVVDKR